MSSASPCAGKPSRRVFKLPARCVLLAAPLAFPSGAAQCGTAARSLASSAPP
jgi:hypothetical protein